MTQSGLDHVDQIVGYANLGYSIIDVYKKTQSDPSMQKKTTTICLPLNGAVLFRMRRYRGDTTCQLRLWGLTALPGSISLVWFYLSTHTMEKPTARIHKPQRGTGDGYARRRKGR